MAINERFIWAANLLQIHPDHTILEIGCGAGLLVTLIANKLDKGKVWAVDRSEAMIRMAEKRNSEFVINNKAKFFQNDFALTRFAPSSFDKILAFNVNSFLKQPVKELALIAKYLKPEGRLYLFYQAPYEANKQLIEQAKKPLTENDFEIVDAVHEKLKPYSAFCIIAQPRK